MSIRMSIKGTRDDTPFDILPVGVCRILKDEELTISYVNNTFCGLLGFRDGQEMPGKMKELVCESDWNEVRSMAGFCSGNPLSALEAEVRLKKKDGEMAWAMLRLKGDPHRNGEIICICLDFSRRQEERERLFRQEEAYRLIVWEQTRKSAARFVPGEAALYLYEKAQKYFDCPVIENMPSALIEDGTVARESQEAYLGFFRRIADGGALADVTVKMNLKEGHQIWMRMEAVRCPQEGGAVISLEDVTLIREEELEYEEWKQSQDSEPVVKDMEEEPSASGDQDMLTGVLDRSEAVKKITRLLARSEKRHIHAILMLDLDRFGQVNETFGHAAGDQVLKEIAYTLKSTQRSDDIIARLGGDEFIICVKHISDTRALEKRMENLRKRIERWVNGEVELTASIGASVYPKDGTTFTGLYQKADAALAQAKELGGGRAVLYLQKMEYNSSKEEM